MAERWSQVRGCVMVGLAALAVIGLPVSQAKSLSSGSPGATRSGQVLSHVRFTASPTDAEFLHTGLFPEPLVPVQHTSVSENRALARAVLAYERAERQSGPDAVAPLVEYLDTHPHSAWTPALQLNLGLIYRQTGHFSRALLVWRQGWKDSRGLLGAQGHQLANAMVARLSQLEAYLGRQETLTPLLDSLQDRSIGGTAAQLITDSHTGLYEMQHDPGESFRCGPLALLKILRSLGANPPPHAVEVLQQARSTPNGLSLSMVQQIGEQAGMHYQMAYRSPGAAVIVPAVAHWKVGHYAAIVGQEAGRYQVQDSTFGEDIRVSAATLDEEASGYFLVPAGALPAGWRAVPESEGAGVWGRGNTGQKHVSATGPGTGGCPGSGGCTSPTVELEVVGLQLHDEPVGYTPPVGPSVKFELYYSHRDTQQPTTFSYTNFGPKWTFTWLSYVTVNSSTQVTLYRRGGGFEPFTFSSSSATSAIGPYSQATLVPTVSGGSTTGFTLTYPDGRSEQFNQAVGSTQFFMSSVRDAAGNAVSLTYDSSMRITAITDAIGESTTLSYTNSSNSLLVTQITDPFGRSANFTYNSSGQLASITDVLGITSSYTYGQATYGQGTDPDFINTLTTPYGSTTFTFGDATTDPLLGDEVFLKTVDALGRASYVEFDQGVDAGDSSGGEAVLPPDGSKMNICTHYLNFRNTFVFDAQQYAQAMQSGTLDHTQGYVYHWLHTADGSTASQVKESEKAPLENRIWYNYAGQTGTDCSDGSSIYFPVSSGGTVSSGASSEPTVVGRVLSGGATQLQSYQYNTQGNLTQYTDPLGRQYSYTYASNGIDRLTVSNTTSGSQLLETRTYNTQHLPLTIKGANGQTAHYTYSAVGLLSHYIDPMGHGTTLNYDSHDRPTLIQQSVIGAKYTLTYDSANRVASVTDPANSTVQYTYDAADRLLTTSYPDGTNTTLTYNLLDLASSTDRLGNTTSYTYDADRELTLTTDALTHTVQQTYALDGQLATLTDQNGHTTTFVRDVEGRVTSKQYADGTTNAYVYTSAEGLLGQVTDALNQTTLYGYNTDNTLAVIAYSGSTSSMPAVSFWYDSTYRRLTSMVDGVGNTSYTYYPVGGLGANQVETVTSPVAGATGSSAPTDTVTYGYDALNRGASTNINGNSQSVAYDGIGRLTNVVNPLDTFTYSYTDATARVTGVSSTNGPGLAMSYYGPTGDELLQQITASTGGSAVGQYGYTYNSNDNVTGLSVALPTAQSISYGYDVTNRVTSALIGTGTPQYAYTYDAASNLTGITNPSVGSQSYSYSSVNTIGAGIYDQNGSPTSLGSNSYTWDGANRVISATTTAGTTSAITYDGLGRVVRIVDSAAGSVVNDHAYLWCGTSVCQARDNTQSGSPVSSQYFDQGVVNAGSAYYYVKDQLGSVRELIGSGSVVAQYDYDPYGDRTLLSGSVTSDIGYAGYLYHPLTGLNFTLTRAYDAEDGRWLNRDTIAEAGGINLYAYVGGNPVSYVDPTGELSVAPDVIEKALTRAGLAEAAGLGPEDPLADVAALIAIGTTIAMASDSSEPSPSASGKGCGPNDPCKGLRDQLAAHQQKLQDYMSNPSAYDNKGFLGQGRDEAVMAGRVRSLQKQIDNFRKLLAECEAQHGSGT